MFNELVVVFNSSTKTLSGLRTKMATCDLQAPTSSILN